MDDISQLGHVPTRASTASAKEKYLYLRVWRARRMGSLTKEQEATLDKLAQASVTKVVQQVRDLGHYPKASAGRSLAERQLAWKLRTVVITKEFSPELEAELQALRLVQQVRDPGRFPKGDGRCSLAERQLAEKLRRALKAKQFSPEQEAELQALRHASPKQEEELMQQVSARRAEDSARRAEELIQQARDSAPEQEAELQALQEEPRDARAQGGDAGTGIRRRLAARNAEEGIRRLSRRTDAT